MKRTFSTLSLALLVCVGAQAATVSSTFTLTGTATLSATGFALTGQATMTGVYSGSGTFASTIPLAGLASTTVTAPFTITTSGGTLTGNYTEPTAILTGASGNASATITGGTGSFAGYTGSFPTLAGSSSSSGLTTYSFSFSGTGTVNTTGGGSTTPVPAITAVQDAASNTPNIAQGSIFIVKGANLSASGYTAFGLPRPTVSSGVKVTFTPVAGGAGTDVYLWYLYNQTGANGVVVNQIACILPSTVAVGSYNVTVTNGTVSSPFVAQVVASKVGLFTQDSSGTGLASVQNYISAAVVDLNRLTTGSISGVTISPAHPGQAVIAYGSGLGAYAAADNNASAAYYDFSTHGMNIQAVVGGVSIPVAYAGLAGYPGEDQINFTLPANVATGCAVSLQISVNGVLSAPTSISIAPDSGSSACVMPGYTLAQLQKLDQGGTITTGGFSITQFTMSIPSLGTEKINAIAGGFTQLTGFQLASAAQVNVSVIQSGSCQVIHATTSGTSSSTGSLTELDAGVVTINGPSGSSLTNLALPKTNNSYSLTNIEGYSIPGQVAFSLPAGSYTLNGAGGNDVGSFNTSLALASAFTVTGGLPSTVVRSSPLTINWTGGNASDTVEIIGGSSTSTGSGSSEVTSSTTFFCITTVGKGTFTVPASILTQLPAATTGLLEVASGNSTPFSATLKSDGSTISSTFGSFLGVGSEPAYQ
jgi:uncharacterized protein (TIGR03437 family)